MHFSERWEICRRKKLQPTGGHSNNSRTKKKCRKHRSHISSLLVSLFVVSDTENELQIMAVKFTCLISAYKIKLFVKTELVSALYYISQLADSEFRRTNTTLYRVRQNKISQHENCYISEMPEYFCTKFRSFVWHITVH